MITVLVIFEGILLKLEKVGPSMSFLAIRCNRQQQTVSIPKNRLQYQKQTIVFGIQMMLRQVLAFLKDSK